MRAPAWREIVLLLACAAALLWQLFLPGFIGLADNRDFARVAGRLCLGRVDVPSAYFEYFDPDFERAQRYCWDSEVPTSELALAWTASRIEGHFGDSRHFDIRWLGAIHALCFLAAWWVLLVALRPLQGIAWWIAAAAALWTFTDVSFVSYLNTFYTDAAAMLGAMIMLPAGLSLLSSRQTWPAVWFGIGAFLFVTSKTNHAALAPVLVGFLLAVQWRKPARVLTIAIAIALMAGACWVLIWTPYSYKAQGRYNLVFYKLLPSSPSPATDVEELGLSQSDLPYIGEQPNTPDLDQVWMKAFSRRGGYGKLAAFWLRHPARMLANLRRDLDQEAWRRRPPFSNFQEKAGRPMRAQTERFASWSALSMKLSRRWPLHVVVWYGLMLSLGPILARRSGPDFLAATAWIATIAAALGIVEFGLASLADGRETDRHLLLFHLFTDFTMFLALVYILGRFISASTLPIRGPK